MIDYDALPQHIKENLYEWQEMLLHPREDGYHPSGLWIGGKRGTRSSSLGRLCLARAMDILYDRYQSEGQVMVNFDFDLRHSIIRAYDLTQLQRQVWEMSQLSSRSDSGNEMWDEYLHQTRRLTYVLQEAPAVLVDDMYGDVYDQRFWNKHLWPPLTQRIKDGLVTVVAGDMIPDDAFPAGQQWDHLWTGCGSPDDHAERSN